MSDIDDATKEKILIEVLLNAKLHDGKPQSGAIIGSFIGKNTDLRPIAKQISAYIPSVVKDVSKWEMEAIDKKLEEIAPEALSNKRQQKKEKAKVRKAQKQGLPDLPNAVKGKIVLRYAPDPSKYPHLGQGMNYLINHMYAEMYDGKIILRFDDTNPEKVNPEYYEAIKDGMKWLGCKWDKEVRASEFIEEFYEAGRTQIRNGEFYFCSCTSKTFNSLKDEGKACIHRDGIPENQLNEFEDMIDGKYQPGEAVIRLKGDLVSDNLNMRDPVLFRLSTHQHPLTETKYVVWPLYDFESAYLESKFGITHVIRSGEFGTMRQELQSHLIQLFGGEVPTFVSFGRFNIQGSPTSGRKIRELVQEGIVTGWDDLRLLTLHALERRGLHPDTARKLIEVASLTPQTTTIAWVTVESASRQLLDPEAPRLFMTENPMEVTVDNAPEQEVTLTFHPDLPELGNRSQHVEDSFWISAMDLEGIKVGDIIRLKDLYNIKFTNLSPHAAEFAGDEIISKVPKIQWVATPGVKIILENPLLLNPRKNVIDENSLPQVSGIVEPSVSLIDDNSIVQMERIGYAKIRKDGDSYKGHFVHKF